jgi:hypothetical protein
VNFYRTAAQLASTLVNRARFANVAGITFGGKRDLYKALGYQRQLFPEDYRSRYERNGIAGRIVDAKPEDTFRGGGDLIETNDPEQVTDFEQAWYDLDKRLKVWPTFQKADRLAGLGQYSIILLGAPGALDAPLVKCAPEDLKFLTAYSQEDAVVTQFDNDQYSARFGLPVFYTIKRTAANAPTAINSSNVVGKRVHFTRVIHIAETLDDRTYGIPRLERVWNLLDDLEKVTGGGAEAFWKRADAGMQIALDPTMQLEPDEIKKMKDETDDYIHGLKRVVRTRGVEMKQLGSDVANIGPSAEAILAQLSASTGIPQRILMGSEQAKLASIQDRTNWDERIEARRAEYAEPVIVRPFVALMIEIGVLPAPKEEYSVGWSQIKTMDDGEKADLGNRWADINQKMGEEVVTANEIRTRCLGLDTRDDIQAIAPTPGPSGKMTGAASRKEVRWREVQRAAERFSGTSKVGRYLRDQRRKKAADEGRSREGAEG